MATGVGTALALAPDPAIWVDVPEGADDGWAAATAARLLDEQQVTDEARRHLLEAVLAAAAVDRDQVSWRLLWLPDATGPGVLCEICLLALDDSVGVDAPIEVEVDAAGEPVELNHLRGVRFVQYGPSSPPPATATDDDRQLLAQVLYVLRPGPTTVLTVQICTTDVVLLPQVIADCDELLCRANVVNESREVGSPA